MYDLHVHILDHGFGRVSLKKKISEYLLKAEMYGFEALGFVDHHELLGRARGIKEAIGEAERETDLKIFYGVEIRFPFRHPLPKRFDYTFIHLDRNIDMLEAARSLKTFHKPFTIAHPGAFGSLCSDMEKATEELRESKISLEASMSRHHHAPSRLFSLAREKGIPLILGSDAHVPSELFSHVPEGLAYTEFEGIGFL